MVKRDYVGALGEVTDDRVGVGGGDKGLVGCQVIRQGMATLAIQFTKNIVE